MAEYYRVAIPSQKKVYKLGTLHSAIKTFPLLLEDEGAFQEFVLYGDETHAFLEDKYEDREGYEKVQYDTIPSDMSEWVERKSYTTAEFKVVFEEFGGKKVMKVNKFDFIKC